MPPKPGRVIALFAAITAFLVASSWLLWPRGVDASAAERATDPACAQVSARWPAAVGGQGRVDVRGSATAVAAWGEPAVIARCGVTSPGPTTDDCVSADGVDWVGQRRPGGMVFVSYGRDPAVEVQVPSAYAPEPLVLSAFAGAASMIPQGASRCR